ncbi:MAG TPA: hypothetical protein ENI23_12005, partial [bacterium]|nr:hypothetical protein [bacterium]
MAKTLEQMTLAELDAREQELLGGTALPLADINDLSPAGLILREEELVDSRDIEDEIELPLTPQQSFDKDKAVTSLVNDPLLLETPLDTILFNVQNLDRDEIVVDGKWGKIGFKEALARKDWFEALPFVGSVYKVFKMTDLIHSVQVINDGDKEFLNVVGGFGFAYVTKRKRTKQERGSALKLIEAYVIKLDEEQRRGFSVRGRIGQGMAELPSFMVEFLLTSGVFRAGSEVGKKAAFRVLGRYAERGIGAKAVKVAGVGIGSFARTGVNIPRILAGTAENMTKGISVTDDGAIVFADADNPFKALARSFGDLYIENLSEIAGPSLRKGTLVIGKGIGKKFPVLGKFTKELSEKWITNKSGRTMSSFLKTSATKVGYDGILEEFGEERLGAILRAVTGLGTFGEIIPSLEELLVEAGIFTVVPVGVNISQLKIFRKDAPSAPIIDDIREVAVGTQIGEGVIATPAEVAVETKAQKVTVDTKSKAIEDSAVSSSVEPTSDLDTIRRNVLRATDVLKKWGSIGRKVRQALFDISRRTAANTGNTTQNIRRIIAGLSAKEKAVVSQLADGAISTEGQPRRLTARANLLKKQLDIMQNEAIKVGLRTQKLSGKAFPTVLNAKGKAFVEKGETQGAQSHEVFAWAQNQVKDGNFKTVDSAIAALQNHRRNRLRGSEGYFEGTRKIKFDIDMREWSPDIVLP